MKSERTFTTRWEVVDRTRQWTMKWYVQCCTLLSAIVDLWSMTFNVSWKVNIHQSLSRVCSSHTSRGKFLPGLCLLGTVAADGWSSKQHLTATHAFLTDYSQVLSILPCIVTGDETWIHYSTPSTKKQMMVWKHVKEPALKKSENGETWENDNGDGVLGSWRCTVYQIPARWEKESRTVTE